MPYLQQVVGPLPALLSRLRLLPNPHALFPELPVGVSYSRHHVPSRRGIPVAGMRTAMNRTGGYDILRVMNCF